MGTRPSGVLTSEWYGWQALPCCGTPLTPMLNQTGELNAALWWMMRYFSSWLKTRASSSSAK